LAQSVLRSFPSGAENLNWWVFPTVSISEPFLALKSFQIQIERLNVAEDVIDDIVHKLKVFQEMARQKRYSEKSITENIAAISKRNDVLIKYLLNYKKFIS